MIPACFINPGDITMMTVPGYPVAGTHTRYTADRSIDFPCWLKMISIPIFPR